MRLLLDTHILLWTVFEPHKLSTYIQNLIADKQNMACVSVASLWEIAIKHSIGKLDLPTGFFDILYKESGFDILPIHPSHIIHYSTLFLHHRDPFDRLLIAQAQSEQLTLITCDENIMRYDVPYIKAEKQ